MKNNIHDILDFWTLKESDACKSIFFSLSIFINENMMPDFLKGIYIYIYNANWKWVNQMLLSFEMMIFSHFDKFWQLGYLNFLG